MATASVSPLTRFDDMDDSFEISFCREQVDAGHRRFVPLFTALTISRELIFPDFQAADEEAQTQRKKYQIISQVAVWSGLAAIVIGLCEIVFPNFFPLPSELLEFAAAAVCVVFILQGTHSKPQEKIGR